MKELRPYQEDAFQDLRASVRQGVRRIVVQAPTGSGKTRLAAEIVVGAQLKSNPLCFVVPAISLIDQTVEMFADEGIRDIGVIQADHPSDRLVEAGADREHPDDTPARGLSQSKRGALR